MKNIDIQTLASYVITYLFNTGYRSVSNRKLNIILYYIQIYLVKNKLEPICARVEAWDRAPIFPDVYYNYRGFGFSPVMTDEDVCSLDCKKKICAGINSVIEKCMELSMKELRAKIESPDSAWFYTYYGSKIKNLTIPLDMLKEDNTLI